MAQTTGKLTALKAQRLAEPGMYADGGGLYLQVTGKGVKSWIYRFTLAGRAREMGVGSFSALSLADARDKAAECRRLRGEGIDPIEARKSKQIEGQIAAAKAVTFRAAADQFIASHRAGWRNAKHAAQWVATLRSYAYPHFGDLPVQAVDTTLVLKALEAVWTTKPETASRLRGRIESILDWATVRGYRSGENPARWRGHLDKLLPARSKVRAVEHHAAMPYPDVGAFLVRLRGLEAVSARALELAILTAARTGEVLGMRWTEIDEAQRIWIVPAARMKAGKEHRVPLTASVLAVIEAMKPLQARRLRLSRSPARQAAEQHGVGDDPSPLEGRCDHPRVPKLVPRLGGGADGLLVRGGRDGAGARDRQQGRGCLPARRPVREASEAYGGVGGVLCGAGRREGGGDWEVLSHLRWKRSGTCST